MDCPKCGSDMEKVEFSGIEVDRCTTCKGIWFDGAEHKRLKSLAGAETIDSGDSRLGKRNNSLRDVPCPVCNNTMVTVADKWQPHIRYEMCQEGHGVYFDAGEFRDFKEEGLMDFFKSLALGFKPRSTS